MKNKTFVESLNAAVEGFIHVLTTQRNMRIHFLCAILVLMIGIYIDLSKTDLLFISMAISLVLISEMINTALELTVDLVKDVLHPVVRIIKDVSAGAVFLSSMNAVVVGYIVFSRNLAFRIEDGIYRIRQSSWHITFIVFILVLFLVIVGKVLSKRGTPFRGGMPSGHAAFAFSIWTIIAFLTEKEVITFIAFIMAVIIARSRVGSKIHSTWEVVAGALLGTLSTAALFQILR